MIKQIMEVTEEKNLSRIKSFTPFAHTVGSFPIIFIIFYYFCAGSGYCMLW